MLLRFEIANAGVLVFDMAGTALTSRKVRGTSVLRESKNIANGQWGFLRNLRGPVVSTADRPKGLANLQTPGPGLCVLGPWERRRRCNRGTVKRRKRSALIVPTQQGSSSREAPGEGSRASSRGPDGRKHGEGFKRRSHVKATLSDSTRQSWGERIHDLRNRMP